MTKSRDVVDRKLDDFAAGRRRSRTTSAVAFEEEIPGAAEHDDEQEKEGELFAFHVREAIQRAARRLWRRTARPTPATANQRGHERDVRPLDAVFERVDVGAQPLALLLELLFHLAFFLAEVRDLGLLFRREDELCPP
jgi:hypothetical protein